MSVRRNSSASPLHAGLRLGAVGRRQRIGEGIFQCHPPLLRSAAELERADRQGQTVLVDLQRCCFSGHGDIPVEAAGSCVKRGVQLSG